MYLHPGLLVVLAVMCNAALLVQPVYASAMAADAETGATVANARITVAQRTPPTHENLLVPAVSTATPRPLMLRIGGGYKNLTLAGSHLDLVTAGAVVNSAGALVPGFNVRIASKPSSGTGLTLSIIAGKLAPSGDYLLRLSYPADDPRAQTLAGPQPTRLATPVVAVPSSVLMIRAAPMNPRMSEIWPSPPDFNVDQNFQVVITDVPGREVVRLVQTEGGPSSVYCYIAGTPHAPEVQHTASWKSAHTLDIRFSSSRFRPTGHPVCRLRFAIWTKNELGEEFYSVVEFPIAIPAESYPVPDTEDLARYLKLTRQTGIADTLGICDGTSLGPDGSFPVGAVKIGRDLSLRIRSGPIGTNCNWVIHATGMRPGWEIRLRLEESRVGNKCNSSTDSGSASPSSLRFDFSALAPLYHTGNGSVILSYNNENGRPPTGLNVPESMHHFRFVNLKCSPTLSNDHAVTMRIVSAELFGRGASGCTWKCAFLD
jgi:hypothetical protein